MLLVYLATACSALSFLSGIVTVGGGSHYVFTVKDIARGRRNALLYVWVTFSAIFSLAHLSSLITYGHEYHWLYRNTDTGRWMAIHSGIGLLLTAAHLFIKQTLDERRDYDSYLWGSRRVR